ncbi:PE domain-containing protein [Mycobacterium sp. HUMS_1102779]
MPEALAAVAVPTTKILVAAADEMPTSVANLSGAVGHELQVSSARAA